MNWMDKLERRFGRFAVRNLMTYLIIFYVFGFLINMTNPQFYYNYLCLDMSAIFHGQVWRLVTFLMSPPTTNVLWLALLSFIYYQLGRTLEQMWGTFRFNLYMLIGIFGYILAALIIYLVWGLVYPLTADNLYLTMLLAFAMTIPDMQFYLYFVIPVKAKWLGIFYGVMIVLEFVTANAPGKVAIAMSVLNFVVFFFSNKRPIQGMKQAKRRRDFAQKMQAGSRVHTAGGSIHRCAVCGRTERDDPNLEFRYCSKCAGSYEYCQDHLYTHVHVTADGGRQ
ncbi:MAG: hypothetical protein J6N77_04755 [Lachnospiraceae bacterium]|nr:hypothetical protein [Lachnospiraceae bacterium]